MSKQKKALLIEDDRPASQALAHMLRRHGLDVVGVRSGENAFETAEAEKPDVILLDIKLSGEVDGFEVLEQLKKHPFLSRVPVLIVTNYGLLQDVQRGLALGAAEYLVKSDHSVAGIADRALKYANAPRAEG